MLVCYTNVIPMKNGVIASKPMQNLCKLFCFAIEQMSALCKLACLQVTLQFLSMHVAC